MTDTRMVYVTCPDRESAADIARTLVEERLAACGNILGGLRSIYRWQGKVEDDQEALLILKTQADRLDALLERVRELHSYEVPEIIAVKVDKGNPDYLAWVLEQTRHDG